MNSRPPVSASDTLLPTHHPRSHLPHYLAVTYALLIIYASLEPFTGWTAPPANTPFFLWAGKPRFIVSDLLINTVAYAPLGFFVCLRYRDPERRRRAALTAAGVAFALSFAMESLQMYLPSRVASILDLASNTAGGILGALPALLILRHPDWRARMHAWRQVTFIGGKAGDLGLALLGLWWLVQVNPAIPLFAVTYNPRPLFAAESVDVLVEAAQTFFNVVGVGLFVVLLLRRREHVGGAVLLLVGSSLMLKGMAAALLLKPSFWEHWLSAGAGRGVAAGCLVLLALVWLPRRAQSVLCSVSLLSALGVSLLAPDLLFMNAPLSHFSWSYGQLLNFNGLTHAVLLVWPMVASVYLFAQAGRDAPEAARDAGL